MTQLTEECTETVEEVKLVKIAHAKNDDSYKCSFSKVCVALSLSIFAINIVIATYYIYSQCYLKKDISHVDFTRTQTDIY